MNRLYTFLGRRPDEVAKVDTTGGTFEVIKLDDNRVRKVLLRLTRGGVQVEMALSPREAEDLHTELLHTLQWTRSDEAA